MRLRLLLNGHINDADLRPQEIGMLAEVAGIGDEPDHLRLEDFALGDCDVLQENLRFLLNCLGHGGKKALAGKLRVDPTTLSRWLNGSYVPPVSTLRDIVSRLGMPPETDLRLDPVFLSAEPVSMADRRIWLHDRIENLGTEELRELFPALRKLLEER